MTLFYLLTAGVCTAYVLLIFSYVAGWRKTAEWPPHSIADRKFETRVSIIIPARNEGNNILSCLAAIFSQKYPSGLFEVILVDDHSDDQTSELVLKNHASVKIIKLLAGQAGKKQAIEEGIKNATGDLIVTTDADCEMGGGWLESIVSLYEAAKPKMIVAPVLLKGETGFQQVMQSQEMTVLTACACASIQSGAPILCSGANLIYEKNAFSLVQGFEGVKATATGDDVFLMLKFHKKFPGAIKYLKSREAVVYTTPARSSLQAIRQRKRWASKSFSYSAMDAGLKKRSRFSHVTGIAILVFFANFLILFSGIMCVINIKFVLVPIVCFSAKFIVDFMLLSSASSFFVRKVNLPVFTAAAFVYPLYVSFIGLVSPFTSYSWKSRRS